MRDPLVWRTGVGLRILAPQPSCRQLRPEFRASSGAPDHALLWAATERGKMAGCRMQSGEEASSTFAGPSPDGLRQALGRSELTCTLHTAELATARRRGVCSSAQQPKDSIRQAPVRSEPDGTSG